MLSSNGGRDVTPSPQDQVPRRMLDSPVRCRDGAAANGPEGIPASCGTPNVVLNQRLKIRTRIVGLGSDASLSGRSPYSG